MSNEELGRKRLEDLVRRKYPGDANNPLLIDSVSAGGEDFGRIAELSEAELEEVVDLEKQALER